MYSRIQRNSFCKFSAIIALCSSALLVPTIYIQAAEGTPQPFSMPFKYKQLHINYDVNADGTYIERSERVMTVLNEEGVQQAGMMSVDMADSPISVSVHRAVEVLSAYTLKKNGARINAILLKPQPQSPPNTASTAPSPPQIQEKIMAFQKVEIGDSLVLSYKAVLKKPIFPNNIVIEQSFPIFMAFDDVEVGLSAPASLTLRTATANMVNVEGVVTGSTRKWLWKYQNKTPVAYFVNQPPPPSSFAEIHISSFKDNAAEMAAVQKLASSMPASVMPLNQHCMLLEANQNDGPRALNLYSSQVRALFWHSEDTLKREVNDWNDPTCIFDDGRPRISALPAGYKLAFTNEKDWSKSLARVEFLKKKFPQEAFVALAEASYWINYAWNARGHGFSTTVTEDGWKLYRDRLEKAESVLLDTKSYADQFPIWYEEMLNVQSILGRPIVERNKVFFEGVKKYPSYYPIYFAMVNYLLPKWGGNWQSVDSFAQWSVEHTKAAEGATLYARIYSAVAGDTRVNLFKDTLATWPKMKTGFEDLMKRHPKSKWNLNNFAKFACLADDKKTFLNLRKQIGKDVIDAAWQENSSLDLCETKFSFPR